MPMTAKQAAVIYKERCAVANKPYSFITDEEKQQIIKSLPFLRKGKFIYPKKMSKELAEKILKLDANYTNRELAALLLSKDDATHLGALIVKVAEKTIRRTS